MSDRLVSIKASVENSDDKQDLLAEKFYYATLW